MSTDDLAAAVDANLVDTWRLLPPMVAGGAVVEGDGFLLADTGSSIPPFNAAFVTAPPTDPHALLDGICDHFAERRLAFLVWCRADLAGAPALRDAAMARGLTSGDLAPGMALRLDRPVPAAPPELLVDEVTDPAGLRRHVAVAAAGFGAPEEELGRLFGRSLVEIASVFVGRVGDVDVATAVCIPTGTIAGIYSVATVDGHRGRGYGEALTWAAVAAGRGAGCEVATLQASALGRPVYERMGFRTVVEYLQLMGPGAPA